MMMLRNYIFVTCALLSCFCTGGVQSTQASSANSFTPPETLEVAYNKHKHELNSVLPMYNHIYTKFFGIYKVTGYVGHLTQMQRYKNDDLPWLQNPRLLFQKKNVLSELRKANLEELQVFDLYLGHAQTSNHPLPRNYLAAQLMGRMAHPYYSTNQKVRFVMTKLIGAVVMACMLAVGLGNHALKLKITEKDGRKASFLKKVLYGCFYPLAYGVSFILIPLLPLVLRNDPANYEYTLHPSFKLHGSIVVIFNTIICLIGIGWNLYEMIKNKRSLFEWWTNTEVVDQGALKQQANGSQEGKAPKASMGKRIGAGILSYIPACFIALVVEFIIMQFGPKA